MKQYHNFAVLALVLVLIFCFASTALAAANGTLTIEAGSPNADGTYSVAVVLSKNSNAEMIQFAIGYDAEKLELVSYAAGSAFSGSTAPTLSKPHDGKVYFVWDALTPLNGGGTLLALTMKAKTGAEGTAALWFDFDEDHVFADADYQEIAMEMHGGSVALGTPATAGAKSAAASTAAKGYNRGITLSSNQLSLAVGDEEDLAVTGSTDALAWISSNESVASVENGRIAALSDGTAIITVSTEDGTKEAACVVTVGMAAADADASGAKPSAVIQWAIGGAVVLAAACLALICIGRKHKRQPENSVEQK